MAGTYSIHGETMTCKIIVRISEENTQKVNIQIRAGVPKLFCTQTNFGFEKQPQILKSLHTYTVSRRQVPKIKNLYLRADFR
jgi:citrate lyase gamma subunit